MFKVNFDILDLSLPNCWGFLSSFFVFYLYLMSLVSPPASSGRSINHISIQTHILWTLAHRLFPTPLIIFHSQLWLINPPYSQNPCLHLLTFPAAERRAWNRTSSPDWRVMNSSSTAPCLVETMLHNSPNNTLAAEGPCHQDTTWLHNGTDFEPSYRVSHICQVKVLYAHPSNQQRF